MLRRPPQSKTFSRTSASEESLRQELELISQENRQLKKRVEKLSHENVEIKRALFLLNVHFSQLLTTTTTTAASTVGNIASSPLIPSQSSLNNTFFDLDKFQSEIEALLSDNAHLQPILSHEAKTNNVPARLRSDEGVGSDTLSPIHVPTVGSDASDHALSPALHYDTDTYSPTSSSGSIVFGGGGGGDDVNFSNYTASGGGGGTTGQGIAESGDQSQHRIRSRAGSNIVAPNVTTAVDLNDHHYQYDSRRRAGSVSRKNRLSPMCGSRQDLRSLHFKFEFPREHDGAIYNIRFSKDGQYLASCSHDRRVIVWDVATQELVCKLEEHEASVLDVAWAEEGDYGHLLVSGGIDHLVQLWDITTAKVVKREQVEGMAQTVRIKGDVASNSHALIFAGDTRKNIYVFDPRHPKQSMHMTNDAMVNCMQVYSGQVPLILTGDHHGMLKVWDMRKQSCLTRFANDAQQSPISSVCVSKQTTTAASNVYERYLAVNSYDNGMLCVYVRVYQHLN